MSEFLVNLLGERLVNGEKAEVDVQALGSKLSLVGLYFGCSLNGPCKQFNASLGDFYSKFKTSSEHRDKLEIVFVSSDQDQKHWQEFLQEMQWPALPLKERHRKMKLWNKYKVTSIPSLVFVDAATGKVVCRNGLLVVRDDPKGLEFPWGPKPFMEVVAGPLLRSSGQTADSSCLEGSYVGVYFSAHWCPPCRSLSRVLVESYRTVKESGQKFEIVFVSADRSEDSFKQYFSEMPWLAVPYSDEGRRSRLNRLYGIQGIPTLILLDAEGRLVTRQGRVEVLNDPECRRFPWHPRPVLELSESNAAQLNEGPCLVLFVGELACGVLYPATVCQVGSQPCEIAVKTWCREQRCSKAKHPLLRERTSHLPEAGGIGGSPPKCARAFLSIVTSRYECSLQWAGRLAPVFAWLGSDPCRAKQALTVDRTSLLYSLKPAERVRAVWRLNTLRPHPASPVSVCLCAQDDMSDSLRDYTNLPEAAPLLTILDMSARAKYVRDVEEITPAVVEQFVGDFLAEKLKPEPI
nr:PREDICTED: nucleoredoxin [Lepisosteus oculatus]